MIAKISTGDYTKGMVLYNHNKTIPSKKKNSTAVLLGTNAISKLDVNSIINSIVRQNMLNENISKPNIHISLNFHKNDILSNSNIYSIAKDYMVQMGFADQPYAVYRHFDTDHPHVHIVSSQINHEGKFIDDSFIYRKSTRISRELEEKYSITKAVNHRSTTNQTIEDAIHAYLEENKTPLLPLLDAIIDTVLQTRPTDLNELDYRLKQYQVVREQRERITEGHVFRIVSIDQLEQPEYHSKHYGIAGREIDTNFSLPAIVKTLDLNKEAKASMLSNIQGRVYSVINTIDSPILLEQFITNLKKKGIHVETKRRQTGDRAGEINGYFFTDIKSNFKFTATELKIKSIELSSKLIDDAFDVSESVHNSLVKVSETGSHLIGNDTEDDTDTSQYETEDPVIDFEHILDSFSVLFDSHFTYPEEDTLLKSKKKKKRKRK